MKIKKERIMSTVAPMYIYATEMVGSYYSVLGVKNKRVLTICGSGDQLLNAYSLGAKDVVAFDLNTRSEFITKLKIVAIKTLSYNEFISFFGVKAANASFDYSLYKMLRINLDRRTLRFFDSIYKKYKLDGKKLVKSQQYFRQRRDINTPVKAINNYLKNEKNYLNLKQILQHKTIKFIKSDFITLSSNKQLGKFHIINLSNVPNYFFGRYSKKLRIKDPFNFICEKLNTMRSLLFDDGLLFYYSYTKKLYPNKIAKSLPPPSRNYNINKIKSKLKYKVYQLNFKSVCGNGLDKIVVLRK